MEKKLIRLACIPVYAIYLWIIISQTMQSVRMESEGGEANEPYRSVTNLAEAIILVGFALLIYLNLFRDQKRMVSFNCFVAYFLAGNPHPLSFSNISFLKEKRVFR